MSSIEIAKCIVSRRLTDLIYIVCKSYVTSHTKAINTFIEVFSTYFSKVRNEIVLLGIKDKLSSYNKENGRKIIVELYLLLYHSRISYILDTCIKVSTKTVEDVPLLFERNKLDEIKDIVHTYNKSSTRNNVESTRIGFTSVDNKYRKDRIWDIWKCLFYFTKTNLNLLKLTNYYFIIFSHNFSRVESRKRLQILYSLIDIISNHEEFRFVYDKVISKSFFEIMLKVDYIYQELDFIELTSNKLFLFYCSLQVIPQINDQSNINDICVNTSNVIDQTRIIEIEK